VHLEQLSRVFIVQAQRQLNVAEQPRTTAFRASRRDPQPKGGADVSGYLLTIQLDRLNELAEPAPGNVPELSPGLMALSSPRA
jgi:hypothetical protein